MPPTCGTAGSSSGIRTATSSTGASAAAGPGEFDFAPVTENDASTSIAVSPDGELIVVGDGNNHRVQVFDGSRRHLRSIGRLGRDDRQFVNPCCVTVDPEHRIWVVDTAQAEVQVFDADGTHLRTFGSPGSGDGELSRPGLRSSISPQTRCTSRTSQTGAVSVFSTDGTWLRHYDRKLNDELRFDEVNLVVVDRAGRLFVVDRRTACSCSIVTGRCCTRSPGRRPVPETSNSDPS